jgi:hypothetical protein
MPQSVPQLTTSLQLNFHVKVNCGQYQGKHELSYFRLDIFEVLIITIA